jgi:hypothetical protein
MHSRLPLFGWLKIIQSVVSNAHMRASIFAIFNLILSAFLGAALAADYPEARDQVVQDSHVVIVCSELVGRDSPSACVENLRDKPDLRNVGPDADR